jgi:hypothetical protein
MDCKRVLELVIVGLWLIIACVVAIHYSGDYNKTVPLPEKLIVPSVPESQKGKQYNVSKIIVLRGDTFDLFLKGNDFSRVLAKLNVFATDNSKEKVLFLLNHSSDPKIVLREKQSDGRWIVDFYVSRDGKEVDLAQWLVSNNLVYK